jgi:uncharacterized protein YqgC (DUF456 family)
MVQWSLFVALVLACLLGTALTALRLPGTWLILVCALLYAWHEGWPAGTGLLLGLLCGAAVIGEIVEMLASLILARRGGASRYASWGGVAGGVLGAIFLSFLIPVFPIGTMAGALMGCFLGAAAVELAARRQLAQGTRVGFMSAIGFAIGMAAKVGLVVVMSAILLASAWRWMP